MDETTLTIIGMIVAFLTASLTPIITESMKNYFQHRTRLQKLRTALYKELWHNYYILDHITHTWDEGNILSQFETAQAVSQHGLRIECYKQALQNELPLFYELDESEMINLLQGTAIGRITNLLRDVQSQINELGQVPVFADTFKTLSEAFLNMYERSVYDRQFDEKILKKFITKQQYEYLLSNGKTLEPQ